jgi:hypothetical protein
MPVLGLLKSEITPLRRLLYVGNTVGSDRIWSLRTSGVIPVPSVAMPVKHCQASDGLRGTDDIEVSSSSTDAEVGAGGLGGKKTNGPG